MQRPSRHSALVLIDVQDAIDAPYWGRRNNPDAEANIASLLAAWRQAALPLIHVRHDSTEAKSAYRPGQPGNLFKSCARPLPGETIIAKSAHSAFVGTALEARLRAQNIGRLVVAGVITNNSVEATIRHGADLGFAMVLVGDACFTFDKEMPDGSAIAAEQVHAMALANMRGEYAEIVDTAQLLAALA
jgi:nicotinamidase-related amidase